jgi:hypothetical protein
MKMRSESNSRLGEISERIQMVKEEIPYVTDSAQLASRSFKMCSEAILSLRLAARIAEAI